MNITIQRQSRELNRQTGTKIYEIPKDATCKEWDQEEQTPKKRKATERVTDYNFR